MTDSELLQMARSLKRSAELESQLRRSQKRFLDAINEEIALKVIEAYEDGYEYLDVIYEHSLAHGRSRSNMKTIPTNEEEPVYGEPADRYHIGAASDEDIKEIREWVDSRDN